MNIFLTILSDVFKLVPYVVAGINVVHAEKSSTAKTQIAQDVLNVATQGALAVLPSTDTATAQAASAAVSQTITSIQAVHDALAGSTPTASGATTTSN